MHQPYDILTFDSKYVKAKFRKSQHDGEDGKGIKSGEDREDKRSRENYWGNKVNLVLKKNTGSEVGIYYYIIYKY